MISTAQARAPMHCSCLTMAAILIWLRGAAVGAVGEFLRAIEDASRAHAGC